MPPINRKTALAGISQLANEGRKDLPGADLEALGDIEAAPATVFPAEEVSVVLEHACKRVFREQVPEEIDHSAMRTTDTDAV